jgi:hypothetical protein
MPSNLPAKRQKTEETPNYSFEGLEIPMEIVPDICESTSITSNSRSNSLMCAETNFFNQRNVDYWHRTDLSHLRPYDFPFVRALLQQPACDTLSPEDIKHKEHVRTSIQVVNENIGTTSNKVALQVP